ncbi:MAG: CoA transferase [Oscillospiraceae bacterium]|nr:CoA transferase [Oscillospiraceae bacterium]
MPYALSKFRIIDLTHMLTGPFATKMLADFGADVIKVERPGTGDDSRAVGPFVNGESMYFAEQNRNKRSIILDLKTKEGKENLLMLVSKADVFVENFRPGVTEKLGLGYETLKKTNPSLIYASCTGFGPEGPMAGQPAYDATIQAISGAMGITGKANGAYSIIGIPAISASAALMLNMGILAALLERERSGRGQKISVSMYDSAAAVLENSMVRYFNFGIVAKPLGNSNAAAFPFSSFHAADADLVIATTSEASWVKLCETLEHTELTEDPRFLTTEKRAENWGELEPLLNSILGKKKLAEWIKILRENNVVCGTINTMKQLADDPQVQDRQMVSDMEHPVAGKVKVIGMPVKFSRTPCEIYRSAPLSGEHTEEILSSL